MPKIVTVALLTLGTVGAMYTQIADPLPARVEARPGSADKGCRAAARDARPSPGRSGRDAGRVGARELRPRPSRRPPLCERLARLVVLLDATSSRPCTRMSARHSRSRSTTGSRAGSSASTFIRTSRGTACSTRSHSRARDGQPRDAQFHSAGVHCRRRDLPQRDHGVARDQPGGEHVRGHAGASSCASATSSRH